MIDKKDLTHYPISKIIREIDRCLKTKDDQTFKKINFKPRFMKLYFDILNNDGITQTQLTSFTKLKPPSISATLVQMEQDGYIKREFDTVDRRIIRIYMTQKGKELEPSIKLLKDNIEQELLSGFTEDDIETLRDLLIKLRNNLIEGE